MKLDLLKRIFIKSVLISALFSFYAFAGVTGKIQGKVVDAKTKEPLPGVNVIIQGTSIGAATDLNGEYFILQVPPGNYTLKASMIGYKEVLIKNVDVRVDLTTHIDFEIAETSVQLNQEVIVVAKRPIIQKDVTSSIQFVGIDELARLPVIDTKQGVFLQAGVYFDPIPVVGGLGSAGRGEQRYSIRGGSQDEVKWYVDGVRNSTLVAGRADWGTSVINVNLNAVQEVQVMTGGFNAEYGDAESGIISVITKEGDSRYTGSLEFNYGIPGQHHFGNYLYDPNTQKEFLDHTLSDGSLDPNWWTPYRQSQIYDYTKIPDHTIRGSLGGPIPYFSDARFFISSEIKQEAYTLPHPRDSKNSEDVLVNTSYRHNEMRLRLDGHYYHYAYSTLQENGDFTNQAKYDRGWGSLLDTYTFNASLHFSNVITQKFFYELKLSGFSTKYKETPSAFAQLGRSKNPTLFGFERYDGYENEPFDKYAPLIYNTDVTGDLSLVGDINWQFDKNNLLKSGFEFRYNKYNEIDSYRFPSYNNNPKYWLNRGLNEAYYPIQVSGYIQDKMEFESMILNLGIRYDFFDPNRDWFAPTNLFNLAVDPLYDASKDPDGDQVDSDGHVKYSFQNVLDKKRTPARTYTMVSPRFGVSFPITENSLLHFNYGHYYQMPPIDEMFEFSYFRPENIVTAMIAEDQLAAQEGRAPKHIPSNDGDPERVVAYTAEPLKPQKTIMFEAGIKHNFENFAVLDVTAFYKDVFDQTQERVGLFDRAIKGYNPFTDQVSANQSYASYLPGDYGDSRGFEISLRTVFSKTFNLDLNYSFSRSTQGRASPKTVTIDGQGNITYQWDTEVNKRVPTEKSYSRPHILRANLYLKYPDEWANDFWGNILKDVSASILYRFVSGQAFTYLTPNDPPDTYNNYRYPATQNVDLRIDKEVTFFNEQHLLVYVQITNLFNNKNLRSFGDVVFDANATKNFVETGKISTVDAGGYDISWQTYFEKRRVYLGAKYSF